MLDAPNFVELADFLLCVRRPLFLLESTFVKVYGEVKSLLFGDEKVFMDTF